MTLSPNSMLGHYRLVAKLGEGGMGVVWRAHDGSLGRDVAIKVLPDLLGKDPERLARFEREAKLLASLNHPGIAAIYGLHSEGDLRYLVMEIAEGENLAERLKRGPMPQREALQIAFAIAEALESAHERGIIHRDLKPANVMVGASASGADGDAGRVKLLDFGLAKAFEDEGEVVANSNLTRSPTITAAMTSANVILGTAAYMSPEQARGQRADRRSDVWSFGVVLYEMLTGRQLFEGETVSDTLASVLKSDPDWSALPDDLPPRVRTILHRALDRDRTRRLRDVGEARIALGDELRDAPDPHLDAALQSGVLVRGTGAGSTPPRPRGGVRAWLPAIAGLAVGAIVALAGARALAPGGTDAPLRKLMLGALPDDARASAPVISPDGRTVAFHTNTHIVVRELRSLEPRKFPHDGTVEDLFWAPDGRSIAYIGRGKLYRIDAQSGAQQTVCEALGGTFSAGAGGSWASDGTIVFSQADDHGLLEVSERGGDPHVVVPTDSTKEGDFHDPSHLPDKRGVLFVPHKRANAFTTIELWAKGQRKVLVDMEGQSLSNPVYAPSGHILFRRTPTNPGIWAVPFSLGRLEVTGEPFLVAPQGTTPSVADDGTLTYLEGVSATTVRLTWNDRNGKELVDAGEVRLGVGYTFPTLARGGERATASVEDTDDYDLWIFDIERGTRTRLTFNKGREEFPVWSPSGETIAYHVRRPGESQLAALRIVTVPADGTGTADTLAVGLGPQFTPDGAHVVFSTYRSQTDWDLEYVAVNGDRSPVSLLKAPAVQWDPHVAPGGRYVAYASDESGTFEIYLTRFPSGQGRWQVSVDGGMNPRWNSRGDRLYFTHGDDIMEVDLALADSPTLGTPQRLFSRPPISVPTIIGWDPGFDVTTDGERFVFFRDPPLVGRTERNVVLVENWIQEFKAP